MKAGSIILILLVIGVAAALIFLKPDGTSPLLSIGGTGNTMDIPTDIPCTTDANCKSWLDLQGAPSGIGYDCVSEKCVFKDTYVPTETGGGVQ